MSYLIQREHESIFVDLNMIFDVDFFVVDKIYRYINCTNDVNDPFYRIKEIVDNYPGGGYNILKDIIQQKTYVNPLMNFMEVPNKDVADAVYYGILFDDEITVDDLYMNLVKNNLGNGFTTLLKDTNLEHLYIYTGQITPPLHSHIFSNLPEHNKIDLIIGDKGEFLRDIKCDNYFFDCVDDTKYLLAHKYRREAVVYCPEYTYNMRVDNRQFVKFEVDMDTLQSKYNINIMTFHLPF